jgi:hypothetical protein
MERPKEGIHSTAAALVPVKRTMRSLKEAPAADHLEKYQENPD